MSDVISSKEILVDGQKIQELIKEYPTPFYVYDEVSILENSQKLYEAFEWAPNYKNFFAVKATPNPHIIKPLIDMGMGLDCSSMAELLIAERLGVKGENIMFTSNNTPVDEMQKALSMNAVMNLDDITHIDFLKDECGGLPDLISVRYNPGALKEGNTIIGTPEDAKYGFTRAQILEGFNKAKDLGVQRFALHTMVASNELNPEYFVETATLLFELAVEIKQKLDISIEFVNLGGGIGIPYMPEQKAVNYDVVSKGIEAEYNRVIVPAGLDPLGIKMENGRVITGPYGYLVSRVIHEKQIYKHYKGIDANMANLMRPGMYGSYHHITVLGKEDQLCTETYDIVGSLCENNDKFAIDRKLPPIDIGDIVVVHDVGAHGHAMGFNYNGKLRSSEILIQRDGTAKMVRRAETYEDYFNTLNF